MLASLEPETLLAWYVLVPRHGTKGGSGVELHLPGCDRCCPARASSSACSGEKDFGVLRARGVLRSVWLAVAAAAGEGGYVKGVGAGSVSVILLFQQFLVMKVPQIQFIDRVLNCSCTTETYSQRKLR